MIIGSLCKHLTAMLSNKKWMQQVAAPVMDWMEKRIDDVNRYLRVKEGEELTLPNELARRNAKMGQYAKMFDKQEQEDAKKEMEKQQQEKQSEPEQQAEQNVINKSLHNTKDSNMDNKEES